MISVIHRLAEEERLTASILAKVFDRIEIRTVIPLYQPFVLRVDVNTLLVSSSVFDKAANIVIRTGPKRGWKLSACAKLRYVFPNHICTMSQAMLLTDHLPVSSAIE